MAAIPLSWGAYAHLQSKLSETRSVAHGGALEEALNIVHQPDFTPEMLSEATLERLADNAGRQARHRSALLRLELACALDQAAVARGNDDGDIYSGAASLDDAVHARRELQKIADVLHAHDWRLLVDAATGEPYDVLAIQHGATQAALRSRVSRIRAVLIARRSEH